MAPVKIATGTVLHGQIVVEGQPFSEGEKVTILSHDNGESFRVSPEEKRLLLESIAQAERGEFVDADELLAELDESN
jgi:redox-sensitive bicupin YhaK (pirin superfamily)